jgi:malate dehydrogenase
MSSSPSSAATPVSRCACYLPRATALPLTTHPQIIPLLSQSSHPLPAGFASDKLEALTTRVQFGGDEVVKAKDGAGSATLSMAYAGAEFASKVLRALKGEKGIVAPSYVHLEADKANGDALKKEIGQDLEYFSANVEIGVRSFTVESLVPAR